MACFAAVSSRASPKDQPYTTPQDLTPGAPVIWRADGGLEGASVRRLLAARGYEVVRWFNALQRPLSASVPEVVTDVRLCSPAPEHEEAIRRAHNVAFVDHWGSAQVSAEHWHDRWTARAMRHDLSTIAVDSSGRVLSYVLAGQWVERELYVSLVGTVPDARGRGLASATLSRTLALATRAGGHDVAELDVDAANATGATRLYERLGFAVRRTTAVLQRDAR